jgi:hypothetical protein
MNWTKITIINSLSMFFLAVFVANGLEGPCALNQHGAQLAYATIQSFDELDDTAIRSYNSCLPSGTPLANPSNKNIKGYIQELKKEDGTGYINTVTKARRKAILPSPPDPRPTKEAAPVEGLRGALELTNCAPQVKSIMAAAVV